MAAAVAGVVETDRFVSRARVSAGRKEGRYSCLTSVLLLSRPSSSHSVRERAHVIHTRSDIL